MKSRTEPELADSILEKALELGKASSWEAVHLYTIAEELKISLDEIRQCFAQKDDIVEAWFDRADQAALTPRDDDAEFQKLSENERLYIIILSWLDALAAHHKLTCEMLAYKLEPGHFHLQLAGIKRISRTVQWFREAAHQNSRGLQRICEEISLTKIYLGTFIRWLRDNSPEQQKSNQYLHARLMGDVSSS